MRLHQSVVDKVLRIYELHGGRKDNKKMIQALIDLDLTEYTQKENPKKETFLVMTEDLQPKPR
jgi:hypothetical protein